MVHQYGSRAVWPAGQPALDLIVTMDDAMSNDQPGSSSVEEARWCSMFRGLLEVLGAARPLEQPLHRDRAAIISPPRRCRRGGWLTGITRRRSAGRSTGWGSSTSRPYLPEARGHRERMFGTLQDCSIGELAKADLVVDRGRQLVDPAGLPATPLRLAPRGRRRWPSSGFARRRMGLAGGDLVHRGRSAWSIGPTR